ncbi:MAG: SLBB domain-containing protein, partial [Nocardioidaceae bacterium]
MARRRLELLRAELAGISRSTPVYGGEVEGRGLAFSTRDEPTVVGDRAQPSHPVVDMPEEGGGQPVDRTQRGTSAGIQPGRHAHRPVAPTVRAGGWVHDRLPPTVQGRVGLASNHLTLVALLVAAGLAVTGWWVIRASGGDTVVPPAVAPAPGAASAVAVVQPGTLAASPAPEAGATSSTVIVVDVAGKVRRPGIATLPLGSRVVDAIEAAGGARRGVDLTALNLARLL